MMAAAAMAADSARMAVDAVARLGAWVSAQPGDYDPSSGRGADWGKAAPAGLLIWLFLGAALFLLIRSMNRHIKKVNRAAAENVADAETATTAAATAAANATATATEQASGSVADSSSAAATGEDEAHVVK